MELLKILDAFILAIIATWVVFSVITSIFIFVFGLILGYHFRRFTFWGLMVANENGKLKVCATNFSLTPNVDMDSNAAGYLKSIIYEVLQLVCEGAVVFCLWYFKPDITNKITNMTYIIMIALLCILYLFHLYILVKMAVQMYGKGEKSVFWREQQMALEQLTQGIHPKNLTLAYREPDGNYFGKDILHHQYHFFQYYKALETGDMDEIKRFIPRMENQITDFWNRSQIPFLYEIIYYYCAINKDIVKAEYYMNLVEEVLKRDKDINGRRVYAAYLFYSGKDRSYAMEVAIEGKKVCDKFPHKGQAYMERDIIEKMIDEMKEKDYENIIR